VLVNNLSCFVEPSPVRSAPENEVSKKVWLVYASDYKLSHFADCFDVRMVSPKIKRKMQETNVGELADLVIIFAEK